MTHPPNRSLLLVSLLLLQAGCSGDHEKPSGSDEPRKAGAGREALDAGRREIPAADGGDAGFDAGSADGAEDARDGGGALAAGSGGSFATGGNMAPAAVQRLRLEGVAQKGPFIRGTSIVVSELDSELAQTGRSFSAQITDNAGRFAVSVTALGGPYVRLSANGFYYNEVSGQLSAAPLALVALSDLGESSSVNVNILTDLETPRVEYLVQHGSSFGDAKRQAQREVLAVFRIDLTSTSSSEVLDVAGSSDADAALLAASVLVQGYLTVSELSELLSAIANDLREDGTLDDPKAGLPLMNAATLVGAVDVREHIEQRYAELGMSVATGNFQDHLAKFRAEAPYPYVSRTVFPKTGGFGPNILAMANGSVIESSASLSYSFTAKTPPGQSLRVRMSLNFPGQESTRWGFGGSNNWNTTWFSAALQDYTVSEPGSLSDAAALPSMEEPGTMRLDFYEGRSDVPSTKTFMFVPSSM